MIFQHDRPEAFPDGAACPVGTDTYTFWMF